jgi:hypothetical protein
MNMSNPRIWNARTNVRCIGWADLLEEWSETLVEPSQVRTFLDNLTTASYANSTYKPTYTQLVTFLNNEQIALKWFLYESIARGWMWGNVRVDFVQRLVDEIDNLDGCFPAFPGSPWTHMTIREWVNENLTEEQLGQVNMMPPLVASNYSYGYSTPLRVPRPLNVPPIRETRSPRALSKIEFRIMRDINSASKDDRITIMKKDDSYTFRYLDSDSKLKFLTEGVSRENVIHTLRMTLRLLSIDEEPYQSIQVIIPSMPTILVKPENLTSQTRDLIYDSVEATMDNWPLCV